MSANPSLSKIQTSATGEIHDLVQQKKRAGERIYDLGVGEPIAPPSVFLVEAVAAVLGREQMRYAPVAGLPELRLAASDWLNRTYRTDYAADETLITCGGKFGLYLVGQTVLKPGDEALVIAPFWVSYPVIVQLAGAEVKLVSTSAHSGFKATADDITRVCSERTKILFLNNGCNPTGAIYNRDELAGILAVAEDKNFLVVSDEVYGGLTFEGEYPSCGSFPEHRERVVVIQSCSKNFAMSGWRVGFVFAPQAIIKELVKLQSQTVTGTATMSQLAAAAVLPYADEVTGEIRRLMRNRRDFFVSGFNNLFSSKLVPPASALYCFIPLSAFGAKNSDSAAFCRRVLEQFNVAMVPGRSFGQEGYVRSSFGSPESELKAALERLAAGLRNDLTKI